ncbi:hypothetical protein Q4I30_004194 [Leishmania utingensis]|uniref:Uncharacterized protein n=1 Tax=Leishmania utingensis TaxID=653362 RepID=A0AAW3AJD0_9TRYP
MPVYAMMQHLRLMRVRSYQLLGYMSRDYTSQKRPGAVRGEVADNPDLHARQLNFELTRLSLVFYLQRLHLRALRHADAMRLETFHFLRYLSSAIPVLRNVWVGQDHCKWPGVLGVVVHIPLNSLIDDDHPALQAFVESIFSVCRGPDCRRRRCVAPSCAAYTHHLTTRLFTSAAPAYWLRWDRKDDTAAMDEMIWEKTSTSSRGAAGGIGAAASPPSPSTTPTGTNRDTGRSARASEAPRSNRGSAASSKRSVWADQMFAYERPHVVLTEPILLVDIDVQRVVKETLGVTVPGTTGTNGSEGATAAAAADASSPPSPSAAPFGPPSDFATPAYAKGCRPALRRRPLWYAAPLSPDNGRSRSTGPAVWQAAQRQPPAVTISYAFVVLKLANRGLRGYLPDFYDPASASDERQATAGSAANGNRASSNNSSSSCGRASNIQSRFADDYEEANLPPATAATAEQGSNKSVEEISALTPRSDVYWGRLSRMRMLESRNLFVGSLATAAPRRTLESVAEIGRELQGVLCRLERISQRNHHEDLAAYFSEVASLARFQNERWSPYRWSAAMINATNNAAQSATQRLYTIIEDNALSPRFVDPVHDIDHRVHTFGELNPRLIGLLSLDVSANPLLTHLFPRTWLSIPYLHSVRTTGTSILTTPLRLRSRLYNDSGMKAYAEEAIRERCGKDAAVAAAAETARDKVEGTSEIGSSLHDKDLIGAVLMPPFSRIDTIFPANNPAEATF